MFVCVCVCVCGCACVCVRVCMEQAFSYLGLDAQLAYSSIVYILGSGSLDHPPPSPSTLELGQIPKFDKFRFSQKMKFYIVFFTMSLKLQYICGLIWLGIYGNEAIHLISNVYLTCVPA